MSTNNSKGLPPLIFPGFHKKLLLLAIEALQKYLFFEKPNKNLYKWAKPWLERMCLVLVTMDSFRGNPAIVARDCSMQCELRGKGAHVSRIWSTNWDWMFLIWLKFPPFSLAYDIETVYFWSADALLRNIHCTFCWCSF